jgi:hypothetical protein
MQDGLLVNPAFCTYAAKATADGEGFYPLRTIVRDGPERLCAGGACQVITSADRGASWRRVEECEFFERSTALSSTSTSTAVFLFSRVNGQVHVVRSDDAGKDWRVVGALPDSSFVRTGAVAGGALIVAAAQRERTVSIWHSQDLGSSWHMVLSFGTDGALHDFQVTERGEAVAVVLGIEEFSGCRRRTELISMSAFSTSYKTTCIDVEVVGGCVNYGEEQWLLGADAGLLLRYNSKSGAVSVEREWNNPDISVSALDVYESSVIAVAETNGLDPAVSVAMKRRGRWEVFDTDLASYVSAVKGVTDGLVLMCETGIYKCFRPPT